MNECVRTSVLECDCLLLACLRNFFKILKNGFHYLVKQKNLFYYIIIFNPPPPAPYSKTLNRFLSWRWAAAATTAKMIQNGNWFLLHSLFFFFLPHFSVEARLPHHSPPTTPPPFDLFLIFSWLYSKFFSLYFWLCKVWWWRERKRVKGKLTTSLREREKFRQNKKKKFG